MSPGSQISLPTFSPRAFAAFVWFLERYFARHFDAVRVSRAGPPPEVAGSPTMVVANHPSWWDPLMFLYLQARTFEGRPAFGPIDADALAKYRLFTRLGAYGVERGTRRGAARFLAVTRALLDRPESVIWITAQGEFVDPRERPVRLRPGVAHAVWGRRDVAVVPLALEYPFWDERAPQALARFGEPLRWDPAKYARPAAFTQEVEARLEATLDALAAEARSRDAGRFETVLAGRAGVGGMYDRIRALAAAARGRRFDPSHRGGRRV